MSLNIDLELYLSLKYILREIIPKYLSEVLSVPLEVFNMDHLTDSIDIDKLIREMPEYYPYYLDNQPDKISDTIIFEDMFQYDLLTRLCPIFETMRCKLYNFNTQDGFYQAEDGTCEINLKYWKILYECYHQTVIKYHPKK
jgi:hypothetical protein